MKRRRFLKIILTFLGSITFFSFFYSLLKFLTALPAGTAEAKKAVLRKSEVPSNEAKNFIYNNTPAVILNRQDKGFVAFSRVCTHLGCLVEYSRSKQGFLCPCHAGLYDLEGAVVSGPPPKALASLPLRIEGETIIIG